MNSILMVYTCTPHVTRIAGNGSTNIISVIQHFIDKPWGGEPGGGKQKLGKGKKSGGKGKKGGQMVDGGGEEKVWGRGKGKTGERRRKKSAQGGKGKCGEGGHPIDLPKFFRPDNIEIYLWKLRFRNVCTNQGTHEDDHNTSVREAVCK
ncbi:unnamed protein product [Calypogeia fissa]